MKRKLSKKVKNLYHPLVSVIINCYNSEKYLKETLDSVYSQTYKNWEIILLDNNSSDKTGDIAKSYDEKLKYFKEDITLPLGAARNKALHYSKGELIAFLDSDDLWLRKKLEKQIVFFENSSVNLAYSNVIFFSKKNSFKLSERRNFYAGSCFRELLSDYVISMPSVIIRKSVLNNLNEWFEPSFQVCEEYDLFLRIAYESEIAFSNEVLAKYRIHENSATSTKFKLISHEINATLDKLSIEIKNFYHLYSKEIDILKKNTDFSLAKFTWLSGNPKRARKILRQHFPSIRFLIFYFFTFFPVFFGRKINIVWNLDINR